MKLVVVSICMNEEKTIAQVLGGIPKKIAGINEIETIVIDDGSKDNTPTVAEKAGAFVVADGANKKLAFRFREAIALALERGADIMVNIDGDMQFNPADIPKMVQSITDGRADFVAADRFTDQEGSANRPANMPAGKYYGNRLGAWVVSKLSKQKFNDVTCGFRAYNRKALLALNINGDKTYTQESFQVLAMKKLRIVTLPTEVKYFPGRKSRVVTSIYSYVAFSAINILRSYRDFAPLRFFGWLGFFPFVIGFTSLAVFIGHWVATGSFSPFKFLGFAGVYFVTLAIIFWALGLVADMLSRMLNNQEKIYEAQKNTLYNKVGKE